MGELEVLRKRSISLVLDGETPGLQDARFLLREQLIGEVRGLRQLRTMIDAELTRLAEERKLRDAKPTDKLDPYLDPDDRIDDSIGGE